ncbi:MAG TPA: amino acid adenylation domain-containing protein [Thermoanaerobaculia bacterium]|nr:amino acid adenylation domain-containing protein [Thermoanaerobaculia bacterium]
MIQETTLEGFRLSPQQRVLWLLEHEDEPGGEPCRVQAVLRVDGLGGEPPAGARGEARSEALRVALAAAIGRHEIFRTTYHRQPGIRFPLQVVEEGGEEVLLWRTADAPDAAAAERLADDERRQPFAPDRLPRVRALLVTVAGEAPRLVLTLPGLAGDARTLANLLDDACRGTAAAREEVPLQYADFAQWQNELLEAGEGDAADKVEALRREALALPPLRLPFARRRAQGVGFAAGIVPVALPPSLAGGEVAGSGLAAVLLAAWQALLARYTGAWELCVACRFDGRGFDELESGCGPYARWLPLPCRPRRDETLAAAAERTGAQLAAAGEWQHYLVAGGEGEPEPAAFFEHTRLAAAPWRLAGCTLTPLAWRDLGERFTLKLSCREAGGELSAEIAYDRSLLDGADVEQLGRSLSCLLAGAVTQGSATPGGATRGGATLAGLDLLAPEDAPPAVATEAPTAPARRPVHRLFEEHAVRSPAAPALLFDGAETTYAALDAAANRLARHLRRRGAGPGSVVALFLPRTPRLVEALLACLKAGAAYSVLEPTLPPRRLAAMLEELGEAQAATGTRSRPGALVVTLEELAATLPGGEAAAGEAVCLDRDAAAVAGEDAAPLPAPAGGDDLLLASLAYVVFTSGSTGRPKGVAVEHRHLAAYVAGAVERLELPAGGRYATVSTFAADLGHTMVFPALSSGGCLHVVAQERLADAGELAEELGRHPADCLKIVPSHLRALLDAGRDARVLPRLRLVLGGEACDWRLVDRVHELAPGCRVFNHYGPTETTVGVIAGALDDLGRSEDSGERPAAPPLGRALAGARIAVLDEWLRPVPPWVAGELYVGGDTVSRGYLGDPARTAAAFLPDPFAAVPGARMYRTGDRARRRGDGRIDFLGRGDRQVKLHGFRIELDEVRAALECHPRISGSAVTLTRGGEGHELLAAYYVAATEIEPGELRAFLAESLLAETLPNVFVRLDRLPLTPNGKLDHAALPNAEEAMSRSRREPVAPRTATEATLARLWAEVLGRDEPAGVFDHFFEMGGHSLLATQLMARVCDELQVRLPLRVLLEDPTVAGLAEAVARERARLAESLGDEAAVAEVLPPLVVDPERRHQPFPLTDVQQAYWVGRSGAFELGNVSTHAYMEIDSDGLDLARFETALNRMIERHEMLRAVVLPDGTQRILAEVPRYHVDVLDLRGLAPETVEQHLAEQRERLSHLVQTPDRWPLFDFRATRLDGGRVRLHVSRDALIFDAWSAFILFSELFRFYADPEAELPALEVSYRDYVVAEKALEDTELYRRDWQYWLRRLDDLPPAPDLPLAADPATLAEPRFTRRSGVLSTERWMRLQGRAARAGLTPSGLVLAAYADVLALWSRTPRFTLNLTLFHRLPLHPQVQELIGDFTSLTLLEVDPPAGAPFVVRARRLQERLWEDLEHRHVGGVRVMRELARRRRRSGTALMPVVLTSTLALDVSEREVSLQALSAEIVYGLAITSQVWLDHSASQRPDGGLDFHWNAVEELFPPGMLDAMFATYSALLERLADDDAAWSAAGRPALPEAELAPRRAANATAAPVPQGLLHDGFRRQAAERPREVAVVDSRRRVAYGELHRLARLLGDRLRERGARPDRLVAVCMEKGWEQVAAVLAVLESGAAYLPVDPALPRERRFQLLARGEAELVLTQPWLADTLEWPDGVEVTTVGDADLGDLDAAAEPPPPVQRPEDLAYVLFTSGSTGEPKGVMIDHRGALNTVADVNQRFAVGPGDRVLALSSLGFDLSVWDVFGVLAAGGTVVMPESVAARDPGRWAELVEEHRVTLWNTVPALLEMLVEHAAGRRSMPRLDSLRLAMLSGDWIPLSLPGRFRSLVPRARVVSLGGATEASIWSILHPVDEVDPEWPSIPYGKAMVNQSFHVLDADLEPRPTWVPGDLYIGGIGLARGYWRDEERTRASFVEHPRTGERLYRTGDVGRFLPDGSIEFLGREDHQVKIQGHRIELGEIEAVLEQHPAVRTAVVTAPGERENRRLVAHVVAQEGAGEPAAAAAPGLPPAGSRIDDPVERMRFKLSQPGRRAELAGDTTGLARPELSAGDAEALYLARRSHRRFLAEPLPAERLGRLLAALTPMHFEGWAMPKYRYASASGLYPVQVYLYVKPARVAGLAGGTYYHDPVEHRLVRLAAGDAFERTLYSAVNRPLFDRAAFAVFLVAQMRAIEPLYGEAAQHLATLEAGLVTQLLETTAAAEGLGLCQVGGLDFDRVRGDLALVDGHVLVHSLLGGAVDAAARLEPDAEAAELATLQALRGEALGDTNLGGTNPGAEAPAGAGQLTATLRDFLAAKLPAYMVPPTFVFLERLPLTANGKLDRAALAAPAAVAPAPAAQPGVAPQGEMESTIAAIWSEVLGVESVGVHDNFFDLGGNSVGMVQVHGRLGAALGREVAITHLFRFPTVAGLAASIAAEPGTDQAVGTARDLADRQREARRRRRGKGRADA